MSSNVVFRYSYSATQNQEVLAIRNKYLPRQESKLDELRRLDRCVQNAGIARGLSVGTVGCLIFGIGMCFALQVIGQSISLGVFLGVCGAIIMIFAYPVYKSAFGKAKEKYSARILELAAELSGEASQS